jgi:hypothetical protein
MIRAALAVFIILFLLPVQASHAEERAEEGLKAGFSGSLTMGGAYISGMFSNLDVVDDNETIDSYTEDGDKLATAVPVLSASLSYTFADAGTTLFLGTTPQVVGFTAGALSAGVTQVLGEAGSITLTGGLTTEEVWKDPYLLGVKRKKTNMRGYTAGLSMDLLGASLSYGLARENVDEDLIAVREPDLDRDGVVHDISLGYGFGINNSNTIMPAFQYMKAVMDGKSNSFDGYGGSLTHMFTSDRHTLSTSVAFARRRFDHTHPVFGKVRDEKDFGGNLTYLLKAPFGFERVTYVAMLVYSRTGSNISFFESNLILGGTGVQYEF